MLVSPSHPSRPNDPNDPNDPDDPDDPNDQNGQNGQNGRGAWGEAARSLECNTPRIYEPIPPCDLTALSDLNPLVTCHSTGPYEHQGRNEPDESKRPVGRCRSP